MPTINETTTNRITRRRTPVALPAQYRNRPIKIRVAIYKAWEQSAILGLTRSTTAVLQALLATGVSITNPYKPIFAKKKTLALTANCSEASVYRALKLLEQKKLIERKNQERLDDGMMDIGLIVITDKLCSLIGLSVYSNTEQTAITDNRSCEYGQNDQTQHSKHTDASKKSGQSSTVLIGGLIDGSIYSEQMVYQKSSVNHQSTRPKSFVWIEGRAVAQELFWLIAEKRLTFGGLFQLQTLAKTVPGQILSDYVSLRADRIRQMRTSSDCYRYLKKLIQQGIDAKYLNQERAKAAETKERVDAERIRKLKVDKWIQCNRDMTVIDLQTKQVYRINGRSGFLEPVQSENNKPLMPVKITERFIRATEEGRVVPHKIIAEPFDRERGRQRLAEMFAQFPWLKRVRNEAMVNLRD